MLQAYSLLFFQGGSKALHTYNGETDKNIIMVERWKYMIVEYDAVREYIMYTARA